MASTMNLVSKSWRQHMEHFGSVKSSLSLRFLKKKRLSFTFQPQLDIIIFWSKSRPLYADGSNPILCHMTRS